MKYPLPAYFSLTFIISWGAILLVAGPGGVPATPEQTQNLLPVMVLVMLLGPSIAGILMTGLVDGRTGYREMLARLLTWRVDVRWYAIALLTGPVLLTGTLYVLSFTSPAFIPGIFTTDDKVTLLLIGIGYGLGAGIFEEIGWTGYAVPRLRRRYGVMMTGIVLGVIWGVWHFLANYWGSGDAAGRLDLGLFLPAPVFALLILPAYRVLMVWVYQHTGSLLISMLMHMSLTGPWLILTPAGISGADFLSWYIVLAVAMWVAVAVVAIKNREIMAA